MTVAAAIRAAAVQLTAISDTARLDAELMMAHALGVPRPTMLVRHMDAPAPPRFAAMVARRAGHQPVSYITGEAEFYGLTLAVSPAVLIPRADSETLIEAAKARFAGRAPARILDLGTGSGCLLLAALNLWPAADGVGIDASAEALAIARTNAARHAPETCFLLRDWRDAGWVDALGRFDLVLANPPYVEEDAALAPQVRGHEPATALFAGADGLDAYRLLIPQLRVLLAPGGCALVEIGAGQAGPVSDLAAAAGLAATLHRDLADRPRALALVAH